jgi:hypothetical protein
MSRLLDTIERPQKLSLIGAMEFDSQEVEVEKTDDPLANLLNEFTEYELPEEIIPEIQTPTQVQLSTRDDRILMTLQGQLGFLRESLTRMHFYLTDVDDSIRR